jgi:hypothetical protein
LESLPPSGLGCYTANWGGFAGIFKKTQFSFEIERTGEAVGKKVPVQHASAKDKGRTERV